MLKTLLLTLLCQSAMALNLLADETCTSMTHSGPLVIKKAGTVIENLIITADPTSDTTKKNDYALKIVNADNVIVRNVIIHHAANGIGIYALRANNLFIENVKVVAYGNEWGAQPCPTRKPFQGYDCSNIKVMKSSDVEINNVQVENGSRGISFVSSPSPTMTNVVAKNPRGQ